ncbi:MAG: SurA N-terminal domain-containing protein [Candidatus Korobacteraceae bacterium]
MKTVLKPTTASVALFVALTLSMACSSSRGNSDAMASVNGRPIPRTEVEKYYTNQTGNSPQPLSEEQGAILRMSILKELIDNEILMQRAEKLGLLATDEEVERELSEIKTPYTEEEFNNRLKERKISIDDFKRDLRRTVTVEKVLNREVTSKIGIAEADITKYYDAHKAEFNVIEPQYRLAHIFVSTVPNQQVRNLKNDKAKNETEARTKIQMILNRLDSGEDFATVAMNWSEDPETSSNGGDLGFTPESALAQTDPATRETLARMKPGQYSGVITVMNPQTRQLFGFRIVRLVTKEPAGQRELADPRVQQHIREQLRDRREQLLKSAYYEAIRNEAKVENFFASRVLETGRAN